MTNLSEANSSNQTNVRVGNYTGCIAELALNFGETHGDASRLTESLEQIAEVCPDRSGETGECLLAPVASNLGIVALESQVGQWWLIRQLTEEAWLKYPAKVLGKKVAKFHDSAECLDYIQSELPIKIGDKQPAVSVREGETINSLIYVQAFGDPAYAFHMSMMPDMPNHRHTPERNALVALEKTVLASMVADKLGACARASVEFSGHSVTLRDEIDGLIIHDNKNTSFVGPAISEDKIVLAWPRTRTVEVELTADDLHSFTHVI